ncbi:hypothetical protein [Sphingobacterium humi]|uniref:Uncharacterized protein n=1 Tax=Sphingobacterium humi TaxID=1796905 RepID=A0A6N8KZ90_9SPHI|nr:hypothetical protein [Sphingobacterium humi]MVZ62144.1 hypothetical protein [Sphingobacterium humi]
MIPIEENKVHFLFRRGKKEHIENLLYKGEIYINTIKFIRGCDDNWERSDKDDSISYRRFYKEALITLCEVGKDFDKDGLDFDARDIIIKHDNNITGNIYCLTGIYSDHLKGDRNNIKFETQSFGESKIFIYNPKKFIERIFAELDLIGIRGYSYNKVEYYDNDFNGEIGPFKKHKIYSHQSEFRIFIPNNQDSPLKLNIGNIEDIAKIVGDEAKLTHSDGKEQFLFF